MSLGADWRCTLRERHAYQGLLTPTAQTACDTPPASPPHASRTPAATYPHWQTRTAPPPASVPLAQPPAAPAQHSPAPATPTRPGSCPHHPETPVQNASGSAQPAQPGWQPRAPVQVSSPHNSATHAMPNARPAISAAMTPAPAGVCIVGTCGCDAGVFAHSSNAACSTSALCTSESSFGRRSVAP